MKLSELKALGEQATSGPWLSLKSPDGSVGVGYADTSVWSALWLHFDSIPADIELIAAMRNHWNALLKIADAVSRNPCRHTADHKSCDTCEALAELERVK